MRARRKEADAGGGRVSRKSNEPMARERRWAALRGASGAAERDIQTKTIHCTYEVIQTFRGAEAGRT